MGCADCAGELAKTLGATSDTVIPAQAGIQGIGMKSCPVFLDSRLRGNDGSRSRRACRTGLDSRLRGNDGREGNDGSRGRCACRTGLDSRLRANDGREGTLLLDGGIFFGDWRIRCPDKI